MASRWSCWCLCVLLMDAVASAFPYLLPADAGAELGVRQAELLRRLRAEDWTTTSTTTATPRTRHRRKKERASRRQRRNSVDPLFTVPAASDVRRLALCPYRVTKNVFDGEASGLRRVPSSFQEMSCENQGCRCSEQGDFRCTQLVSQLEVAYLDRSTGRLQHTEVVDVDAGCVCSARRGQTVPLRTPKPPTHLLPDGRKSNRKKLLVSKKGARLVSSSLSS